MTKKRMEGAGWSQKVTKTQERLKEMLLCLTEAYVTVKTSPLDVIVPYSIA